MKIATYLIKNGYLSQDQAEKIIRIQQQMGSGIKDRFGRIAINEGYISEKMLNKALLQKERGEFGYKQK